MQSAGDTDRLLELANGAIDGQLSDAELLELQNWVINDRGAAKAYAEFVAMHATLWMSHGRPVDHKSGLRNEAAPTAANWQTPVSSSWSKVVGLGLLALVALLFLALTVRLWQTPSSTPAIARLAEVKGCTWGAGSLPTEAGAELSVGRMRLVEGLARIVFNNGVEIRLESPADFELVSPMKCIMRSGKLVAAVPANAKGFVVETPSSVVTDFGTEFGVSVGNDQSALVQVFRGRVDTLHRRSGETKVMTEGAVFLFGDESYGPSADTEPSSTTVDRGPPKTSRNDFVQITTAQGRGRDTYVQPTGTEDLHRDKALLLVKRPFHQHMQWERRVYLGFDLTDLGKRPVGEAELSLTFAPTGLGFASLVPDATFHVYGLADGPHDEWNESEMTWESAPGNDLLPATGQPSALVLLGSFTLAQGDQSSTVCLSGHQLKDFLNADTNQLATLIIVRETVGLGCSDLVHGFASRRHPTLPPPTLRLKVDGSNRLNEI